ncbi:hypothetical protein [Olivibacter sitiensis]|uniref:hypothetical protein n=1 Tax=Olivibacter sitiensis TaxID=376470 RepID=UPI00055F5006|nr:hypothetical protein [Olivibacter sitiensis]
MKSKNWMLAAGILVAASFAACGGSGEKTSDTTDSLDVDSASAITVTPVADSKAFPGAELAVSGITTENVGDDSVKFTVNYDVKNFTLTEHTDDHNADHMANSAEGQHIHFILDNTPYVALYKPTNSATVKKGTEHYLLSFLSRSYHESIKEPKAYVLKHFKITDDGKYEELPLPTEPSLFYSRPKGEYKGKDTENLLLDFYLVNTTLSADGNKVKADVNGEEFVLDNWGPYEIKGLPKGETTVKLTLLGADGNALSGDNVSIERKVTLTE